MVWPADLGADSEITQEVPRPGVALIRLAAEARRNALTVPMAIDLAAAIRAAAREPTVGAVVISGGPITFSAGAHRAILSEVARGEPRSIGHLDAIYDVFDALRECCVPTVAAVCGAAVGAGLNVALACDVRIVAENAVLRSMFLANVIHPAGGHLSFLDRAGGRQVTVAMAMLDEPIDGVTAARLGLALRSLPAIAVEAAAVEMAARAGARPTLVRLIAETAGRVDLHGEATRQLEAERQLQTLLQRGS